MEKLIIDRIEEGIAILEKDDGAYIKIPVSDFEFELREGDILNFDGEKYILNEAEKEDKRNKMLALQRKLAQKGKKE